MHTVIRKSKDPVITFAVQEWNQLSEQHGHLWRGLTDIPVIHIDPWDHIRSQQLSPQLEKTLSEAQPKQDSYWIETQPDKIIISGESPRATLYAVYDAFKRYAGVHWIYPGEPASVSTTEHASPLQGLAAVLYEPWFERRGFVIENLYDPEYIGHMVDWLAKNRVNEIFFTFTLWDQIKEIISPEIIKRGINLTLGGHSMKFFINPKEAENMQAADHPYTAKKQLDYSDTAWQTPVFDQIASYCAAVPQLSRVSLWPEDMPAKQDSAFLAQYIRFTETLQQHLRRKLPGLEVEHIAYNAGLSWDMLERSGVPSSDQSDTLLAYWGRDYRYPFRDSPQPSDLRAEQILKDWIQTVHENHQKLTVFEYYSDHFMLSPLFPSIPARVIDDAAYYQELGVDGLTNLIVPCPGYPDYPWKWANGLNSYAFSRAMWGDSPDEIMNDYYSYYPEDERDQVKSWMEAVEEVVTVVTAWNFPLFPARIVDTARMGDNLEYRGEVSALLEDMHQRLSEAYGQPSEALADSQAAVYMKHLIELSRRLQEAWSSS